MPRNPIASKILKVEKTRDSIRRLDAMLADARKEHRRALLEAREAGVTLAELGRRTGSSNSRLIENTNRAKIERDA